MGEHLQKLDISLVKLWRGREQVPPYFFSGPVLQNPAHIVARPGLPGLLPLSITGILVFIRVLVICPLSHGRLLSFELEHPVMFSGHFVQKGTEAMDDTLMM